MTAQGPGLGLRAACEFTATAFLLIAVVGSGMAAENLSGGNAALALLANALATGCALFVLILVFAPLSGAHMNPVVTLAALSAGELPRKDAGAYVAAQIAGGFAGVALAHAMFAVPLLQFSAHARSGGGQWLAEFIATLGLLGTILGTRRHGVPMVAGAVAAYITGAYWFTASTSFANPAVTLARMLTDTFSGIRPADAPGFIAAQVAAVGVVVMFVRRR